MSTPLDAATVDLLGVLAYGELTAFERLATDARLAPTIADKHALASMAAAEFEHYRCLYEHLRAAGVDPEQAMAPFVEAVDGFHDLTPPNDWLEGLIKAYVGDGLAADFYREVAAFVQDAATRCAWISASPTSRRAHSARRPATAGSREVASRTFATAKDACPVSASVSRMSSRVAASCTKAATSR